MIEYFSGYRLYKYNIIYYGHSLMTGLGSSHSLLLVALRVHPEGECNRYNIICYIIYLIVHSCLPHDTYILGHSTAYLLVFAHILDGTAMDWIKSSVFIHLTQLPSNPIIFGFGWLALRCDFSKTKIQPIASWYICI